MELKLLCVSLGLSCLLTAVGAVIGFQDTPCLANRAYSPSERRNVTIGGVSQPLLVGSSSWAAARVESAIFQIVVEEMLGIQTVEGPVGPHSPASYSNVLLGRAHVLLDAWQTPAMVQHISATSREQPDQTPIWAGSMGYEGQDAFFLREGSPEPDRNSRHLPLNFYLSYSHPHFEPLRYFTDYRHISTGMMQPCEYLEGDLLLTEFAEAACGVGHWWLSPACSKNASSCVPVVSGGSGWGLRRVAQQATAWNLPLALGVAASWQQYDEILHKFKVVFYWYSPERLSSVMNSTKMVWPQTATGIFKTESAGIPVWKWAFKRMDDKANDGTAEPMAVLRSMRFNMQEMQEAVESVLLFEGGDIPKYEAAACQWLRKNTRWQEWVPLATACTERQGLVAENVFVDTREKAEACLSCSPGRMSEAVMDDRGVTYRCAECPTGRFQDAFAGMSCKLCSEGSAAADTGMSSCERCPLGTFASEKGHVKCSTCPEGFTTSVVGSTSKAACVCPEGHYQPDALLAECLPCPLGMLCPQAADVLQVPAQAAGDNGGSWRRLSGAAPADVTQNGTAPVLKSGFWSSAEDPFMPFRCESDLRCPGGLLPGQACAPHLESRGCAHCEDGYYWDGAACWKCADYLLQTIVVPVVLMIAVPIFICFVYWMSIDEYSDWNLWYHAVSSSVFILLNHYQITNVIRQTNLAYTEAVAERFEYFAFISDVLRPFRLDCHGMKSFRFQLLLQSLGPLLALLAYLVVWGGSQVVGLRCPKVKMGISRTIDGFMSLMMTFFTGVADSAFTIFKCGSNPSGFYTLLKDRSIICYQGEWDGMVIMGVFAVLFWCVGFAGLLARAIWVTPQYFHELGVQQRWRFLFIRYRPDVHWWALIFVAKGVIINMGSLITSSGLGQLTWIVVTILAYTYLTAVFRPWRHPLNSHVDLWVHLCLFLICTMMAWFAREASNDDIDGEALANLILTTFLCGVSTPILFTGAYQFFEGTSRGQTMIEKVRKKVASAAHVFQKSNASAIDDFLRDLNMVDLNLMASSAALIQTELAHRRSRHGYSTHKLRAAALARQSTVDIKRTSANQDGTNCRKLSDSSSENDVSHHKTTAGRRCTPVNALCPEQILNELHLKRMEI